MWARAVCGLSAEKPREFFTFECSNSSVSCCLGDSVLSLTPATRNHWPRRQPHPWPAWCTCPHTLKPHTCAPRLTHTLTDRPAHVLTHSHICSQTPAHALRLTYTLRPAHILTHIYAQTPAHALTHVPLGLHTHTDPRTRSDRPEHTLTQMHMYSDSNRPSCTLRRRDTQALVPRQAYRDLHVHRHTYLDLHMQTHTHRHTHTQSHTYRHTSISTHTHTGSHSRHSSRPLL